MLVRDFIAFPIIYKFLEIDGKIHKKIFRTNVNFVSLLY